MGGGMTIGQRIREARQQSGLKYDVVLLRLSVPGHGRMSRGILSRYERDINEPTASKLGRLARVLNVTTDWLIYGDPSTDSAVL